MKKFFKLRIAEMSDITAAQDRVFDRISDHRKEINRDFAAIEARLNAMDKTITSKTGGLSSSVGVLRGEVKEMRETAHATDKVLDALIDETFTHLPAKKNAANLTEYHHKRMEKVLAPKDNKQ